MKHLGYLKSFNVAYGVVLLVIAVLVLVAAFMSSWYVPGGEGVEGRVAGGIVVSAFFFALGTLMLVTASRVVLGRWRLVQTVLAVLSLGSFPVGTAYGVYAIWVCWFNQETKAVFG